MCEFRLDGSCVTVRVNEATFECDNSETDNLLHEIMRVHDLHNINSANANIVQVTLSLLVAQRVTSALSFAIHEIDVLHPSILQLCFLFRFTFTMGATPDHALSNRHNFLFIFPLVRRSPTGDVLSRTKNLMYFFL